MKARYDSDAPLVHRMLIDLGYPFGLNWVGDNEVAVVYRLERYDSLKGPGFFWINPLTQRVEGSVRIAPDFVSVPASNIHTRDALQLGLTVALAYCFDPALLPADKERAAVFLSWSRDSRRAIVANHAQRALQDVVPAYFAEEICRGEVFEPIERKLLNVLAERLKPLALNPIFCMVLRVEVPLKLQDRFESVVQRRVNIDDISQYLPYELNQALRTEALEALRGMSGSRQYINLPDFTDVVAPLQGQDQPPPRRIARPGSKPVEPTQQQEPPPGTGSGSSSRPKSRL